MRSSKKIRELLLNRLNGILKQPEMDAFCESDLELRLRELIYDLCYIDRIEIEGDPIREELFAYGIYYPANVIDGVSNVFKNIMPKAGKFKSEICSVYAGKAHKIGYLDIKNILNPNLFNEMTERIMSGEFSKGYNKEKLLQKLPVPSFVTGTTLCYVSEEDAWICFDISRHYTKGKGYHNHLRSIRWTAETFEEGFELTKEGYEETERGVACPKLDENTFMELWKDGKKWAVDEPLPVIYEEPRKSQWQHLW
ncbi:hypothetical protein DENIS_5125 [Desulfonema ishimotonii]|uniref:Uncharacterized protein n=2 Tax=Desulfonema ishimotonii TaxID=45657 RepID=A0A401G4D8_9BACT|nr:hypothetical protein DENIS_5125 [Desulfonema ishimotonii]